MGIRVEKRLADGGYVSDQVVLELVDLFLDENMKDLSESGGLVFDGFPRTFAQAEGLGGIMKQRSMELGIAIFLKLDQEALISRLTNRRCCSDCGAVFNLNQVSTCNICGGDLYKRPDDEQDVVLTRIEKYETETLPLKKYYKDLGVYRDLSAEGGAEEVNNRIISLIDEILLAR